MWLNLGPLLYHWADAHTYLPSSEVSVELSLEDIERLAVANGLTMLSKEIVSASFNQDPRQGETAPCAWLFPRDPSLLHGTTAYIETCALRGNLHDVDADVHGPKPLSYTAYLELQSRPCNVLSRCVVCTCRSMQQAHYECAFWVMQKTADVQ